MKIYLNAFGTGGHEGIIHSLLKKTGKAKAIYYYKSDRIEIMLLSQPSDSDIRIQDDVMDTKPIKNGFSYERDPKLREKAVQIHGNSCIVCNFNFYQFYGPIGLNFIHIHHIIPVSVRKEGTNPETELVPLCPNCHSMIHRNRTNVLTVEELKIMIKERKDENISINMAD